jgi:hypothetical protein
MFQKNNLMDIGSKWLLQQENKKTFGHTPQLINKKDDWL